MHYAIAILTVGAMLGVIVFAIVDTVGAYLPRIVSVLQGRGQ